jgi:hypothetical protein
MTPGQRIRQIQSEERQATLDMIAGETIAGLTLDELQRGDVTRIFAVIQQAVNQWIAAEDRTIDGRTVPIALILAFNELERVYERLADEDLTLPVERPRFEEKPGDRFEEN